MAQRIKARVSQLCDLSLISGTHVKVEGEYGLCITVSDDFHVCTHTHTSYTHQNFSINTFTQMYLIGGSKSYAAGEKH